jgi:hypothetical protein
MAPKPLIPKVLALTVSACSLAVFVFLGLSSFAEEAEAASLESSEADELILTTPQFTVPFAGPAISVPIAVLAPPEAPEPEPPKQKKRKSKKYAMGY